MNYSAEDTNNKRQLNVEGDTSNELQPPVIDDIFAHIQRDLVGLS